MEEPGGNVQEIRVVREDAAERDKVRNRRKAERDVEADLQIRRVSPLYLVFHHHIPLQSCF